MRFVLVTDYRAEFGGQTGVAEALWRYGPGLCGITRTARGARVPQIGGSQLSVAIAIPAMLSAATRITARIL